MSYNNPAPYGRRALAFIIDVLYELVVPIPVFLIALVMLFFSSTRGIAVFLIILGTLWLLLSGLFNRVVLQGRKGSTWGKTHMKLSLVQISNGEPIGFWLALLRWFLTVILGSVTGGLLLLIDLLAPAFSSTNQRILDRLLGTLVVDDTSFVNPSPGLEPPTAGGWT